MAIEMNWSVIVGTALGGVLAIIGGMVATYYAEAVRSKRLERNLAWAFHGEIGSLCNIVRLRSYVEAFRQLAADARNGIDSGRRNIRADKEYFHVYKNNVAQIGMLTKELPQKIATFYVQGTAILEDFSAISSGFHDDKPLPAMAEYYDEIANLFYDILRQGDEILQIIERKYP